MPTMAKTKKMSAQDVVPEMGLIPSALDPLREVTEGLCVITSTTFVPFSLAAVKGASC